MATRKSCGRNLVVLGDGDVHDPDRGGGRVDGPGPVFRAECGVRARRRREITRHLPRVFKAPSKRSRWMRSSIAWAGWDISVSCQVRDHRRGEDGSLVDVWECVTLGEAAAVALGAFGARQFVRQVGKLRRKDVVVDSVFCFDVVEVSSQGRGSLESRVPKHQVVIDPHPIRPARYTGRRNWRDCLI